MGCSNSNSQREFTAIQSYLRKQQSSNEQPNLIPMATEKDEHMKPKLSKKERSEQKKRETEMKKRIEKTEETKS